MRENYKIPNRIKNLCTSKFLFIFKEELMKVFNTITDDSTAWSDYFHIESTCGFYRALENACNRHPYPHMGIGIWRYARSLDWYNGDLFDDELVNLMVNQGIIKDGSAEEYEDGYDEYYKDAEYEMIYIKDVSGGKAYRREYK